MKLGANGRNICPSFEGGDCTTLKLRVLKIRIDGSFCLREIPNKLLKQLNYWLSNNFSEFFLAYSVFVFFCAGKRTPGGRQEVWNWEIMFLHSYNFLCANTFFGPRPPQLVSMWPRGFAFVCVCISLSFYLGCTRDRGGGILLEDKTSAPDVFS